MKTNPLSILLIMLFFISACTPVSPRVSKTSVDSAEAQHLLTSLKNKNHTLNSFKGIGKIKIWDKDKFQIARVAWLGAAPGKLRIEALNVSGQPVASIAGDGKWFYYRNHDDFYKKQASDPSLKKIVSVPVRSSDIFSMLAGRVPIQEHHLALIVKHESEYVLELQSKWGNIIEKIYFDTSKTIVSKIEMFDAFGSLTYRAAFGRIRTIGDYQIPFTLELSDDDDDAGFQLHISNYWTGVPVPPSKFILTPTD
ncbi:DUF4292 [Desulfonema magnum]|uniref:DUF4292 n=2 Tax=Desulfonema magnum TaxID=45655 RepID=A0A975GSL3_9BACT|nr:DUF4292 [Desulfonema magnum]